jgi:hypothetical protein
MGHLFHSKPDTYLLSGALKGTGDGRGLGESGFFSHEFFRGTEISSVFQENVYGFIYSPKSALRPGGPARK